MFSKDSWLYIQWSNQIADLWLDPKSLKSCGFFQTNKLCRISYIKMVYYAHIYSLMWLLVREDCYFFIDGFSSEMILTYFQVKIARWTCIICFKSDWPQHFIFETCSAGVPQISWISSIFFFSAFYFIS